MSEQFLKYTIQRKIARQRELAHNFVVDIIYIIDFIWRSELLRSKAYKERPSYSWN